ncbi:MAG: glycosyltransferase [Candidatus Micrarchaeaceae archaeon]
MGQYMMVNPHISIVLATYNEELSIRDILEGIKKGLKDLEYEIILIDGFSQDHTVDIAKKYTKKIWQIKDKDLQTAIIYGLSKARGDIIISFPTDMTADPKSLNGLIDKLDNKKYDFIALAYRKKSAEFFVTTKEIKDVILRYAVESFLDLNCLPELLKKRYKIDRIELKQRVAIQLSRLNFSLPQIKRTIFILALILFLLCFILFPVIILILFFLTGKNISYEAVNGLLLYSSILVIVFSFITKDFGNLLIQKNIEKNRQLTGYPAFLYSTPTALILSLLISVGGFLIALNALVVQSSSQYYQPSVLIAFILDIGATTILIYEIHYYYKILGEKNVLETRKSLLKMFNKQ